MKRRRWWSLLIAMGGMWYAWSFVWMAKRKGEEEQLIVFVGGLQRSGTTVAASMLSSLVDGSVQSVTQVGGTGSTLERVRKWRGLSRSYFEDVVKSGGLEGKFVQNVYPYRYFLRDWNGTVDDFVPKGGDGRQLWEEWRPFWDSSKRVLIEKTPENVAMAPFLQSAMAAAGKRVAFLVVLRHPLAWSLAIDKWLKNKWNKAKTKRLLPIQARIDMWLEVADRFFRDAPKLSRRVAFHAEYLDLAPTSFLIDRLTTSLLGTPKIASKVSASTHFRGYTAANLQYVACWLAGGFTDKKRHCKDQKGSRGHERMVLLDKIRSKYRNELADFGYVLPDFSRILCSNAQKPATCFSAARWENQTVIQAGSGLGLNLASPKVKPYLLLQAPYPTTSIIKK